MLAGGDAPLPAPSADAPPEGLRPLAAVVLAEELRPGVRDTIAYLQREGIEIKVLSGDAAPTVAAIARDVGIPVSGISGGRADPRRPGRAAGLRPHGDDRRADLGAGQAGDRAGAGR